MSQMNYEINHKITLQKGLCSMKLPKYFFSSGSSSGSYSKWYFTVPTVGRETLQEAAASTSTPRAVQP